MRSHIRKVGINAIYNEGDDFMAGQSMMFSGPVNKIPAGWLIEDGSAISRTAYATLFAVIGATYGPGDGVNTFNVPDSRADVWRALDLGKGKDVGRVLGTKQGDAIRNIYGGFHINENGSGRAVGVPASLSGGFAAGGGFPGSTAKILGGEGIGADFQITFDASRIVPTASENRMLNIAKIPLIKYS